MQGMRASQGGRGAAATQARGASVRCRAVREVFMPALSSTMTEGKIVEWLKAEGDKLEKGESIVVVESDKADMDVETFYEGFLGAVVVESGGTANVGEAIAYIAETEAEIDEAKAKAGGSAPAPAAPAEGPQGKSAKRREAKRRAAEREAEIERAERDRLANAAPRTEADFQGLILANPNSSYAWIRYMAHFLSIDEVGKAREKAAEALERINFREQKEKLNVWVALLNLELRHGQPSGEAAALGVFKRALPLCDPRKLHLALLGVLQRDMAGARDPRARRHAVDEVFKNLHKKFGQSCKVWLRTVEHHLQRGDAPRAQAALDRALQRLPKRKHIKAIAQNALLEYRAGDPERGRNLYESVLLSYPKRTDLWNVYLDQETKLHREREPARVRTLYQRITAMALPLKKMKGIFKRWLEFEEGLGDAAAAQAVKDRAMAFVEQRA